MQKEKIIFDIKRYINKIPTEKEEDKFLYYAMINIIEGKKTDIDFDELFEKLEEEPEKKFDPKKLKNLIGPINNILNDIEENEEKEFEIKKLKSENVKKLIEESHKNTKITIKAIKGERGKLLEKDKKTSFLFKNDRGKTIISFDAPLEKENKLFRCKEIKNINPLERKIYFFSEKYESNNYDCILFDEKPQDFEEKYITREDIKNGIGILKQGSKQKYLLLLEDNNDFK